jgi:hypothetical protein
MSRRPRPRPFAVERRQIPDRRPQVETTQPNAPVIVADTPPLGPIAREVAYALRESPIRFPKDWMQAR